MNAGFVAFLLVLIHVSTKPQLVPNAVNLTESLTARHF